MNKIIIIVATILIFGLAGGVYADYIDFTSNAFSTADEKTAFVYEPAGLTITPGPKGAELYWDEKDGFGVRSSNGYEYDEIEGTEYLHLSFNAPQLLNKIMITDLFVESYDEGIGSYLETGYYSFNNESLTPFYADNSQILGKTNGELSLLFFSLEITDVWFKAPGKIYLDGIKINHDFSVAGIDVTPVPEPATILLFGSGLAGIFGLRRRYKK